MPRVTRNAEPHRALLNVAADYSRIPIKTLRRWSAQGRLSAPNVGSYRIQG